MTTAVTGPHPQLFDDPQFDDLDYGPEMSCADDPTAADYSAGHVYADTLGKVDSTLLTSGVRWCKVRLMPRAIRVRLALEILGREMPASTRTCWEGGRVWLDEALQRIDRQPWQRRRRDTWTAVALLLAESTPSDRRPLTEISHKALSTAIDVTPRYITKIMKWFCDQGLLARLLGGTQFPRLEKPQDETPAERAARRAREHATEQARRAQRQHARDHVIAELDAIETGRPIPAVQLDPYREFRAAQHGSPEQDLVPLASVYELRVPVPPPPPPPANVISLNEARRKHRPQNTQKSRLTSAKIEMFTPTDLGRVITPTPDKWADVDKRRASRGRDQKEASRNRPNHRPSRRTKTQRTVQALLEGPAPGSCDEDVSLPGSLTRDVKHGWLEALLKPLVTAGWQPLEIAWHLITRGGKYATLPAVIHNPPGWIRASLKVANPLVRPSIKWEVFALERDNLEAQAARAELIAHHDFLDAREHKAAELRRGRAKRAAIEACTICDERGWLTVADHRVGAVQCNHDPDSGGW